MVFTPDLITRVKIDVEMYHHSFYPSKCREDLALSKSNISLKVKSSHITINEQHTEQWHKVQFLELPFRQEECQQLYAFNHLIYVISM